MKMLSPIKCLRVFLKEGTSSVWGLGERQNTGGGLSHQVQRGRHGLIHVMEDGRLVLRGGA